MAKLFDFSERERGILLGVALSVGAAFAGLIRLSSLTDRWEHIHLVAQEVLNRIHVVRRAARGGSVCFKVAAYSEGNTILAQIGHEPDPDGDPDLIHMVDSAIMDMPPRVPNMVLWPASDLALQIHCGSCDNHLLFRGNSPGAIRCHRCGEVYGLLPFLYLREVDENYVAEATHSGMVEIPMTEDLEGL